MTVTGTDAEVKPAARNVIVAEPPATAVTTNDDAELPAATVAIAPFDEAAVTPEPFATVRTWVCPTAVNAIDPGEGVNAALRAPPGGVSVTDPPEHALKKTAMTDAAQTLHERLRSFTTTSHSADE